MRMRQKLLKRPTLFSSRCPMARFPTLGRALWRRMAPRRAMRCSEKSYAIARARFRQPYLPMQRNMVRRLPRCIRFRDFGRGSAQAKIGTALFTLEGDESALASVSALLDACGVHHRKIASSDKPLYHAAAVCASNLAVGLFASAQTMLERCGFGADEARGALRALFVGNCESIAERGPIDALTGPIERNDAETVVGHLMAFREDQNAAEGA